MMRWRREGSTRLLQAMVTMSHSLLVQVREQSNDTPLNRSTFITSSLLSCSRCSFIRCCFRRSFITLHHGMTLRKMTRWRRQANEVVASHFGDESVILCYCRRCSNRNIHRQTARLPITSFFRWCISDS